MIPSTRLMRTSSEAPVGLEPFFGRGPSSVGTKCDILGIVVEKAGDADRFFSAVVDFSAVGARVALVAHPDVLFGFFVRDDAALEIAQDDLVFVLGNDVVGVNRDLASTAGASTTKVGTARPEMWPRRCSMISMPLEMVVRKCSRPSARSH